MRTIDAVEERQTNRDWHQFARAREVNQWTKEVVPCEEEMEQAFYIGVLQSVLSKSEMALVGYYAISGIEEDYISLIQRSKLLKSMAPQDFAKPEHSALLSLSL